MKIEELYLNGFGHFVNKKIVFQDGFNLIYGGNEAGKTTLQHFIVGMLYGFFVPEAKRKTYTDEYERYQPWNSSALYSGTLVCKANGRRYRIERVFQKDRENVTIFDADTGKDISENFPYDIITRLREPGKFLTGVSKTVFCSTAIAAQLEIAPKDDFAVAWEEQVISLTQTADSNLSLKNVFRILDEKAEEIGSPKRKKTPYGQAVEKLETLKSELENVKKSEESKILIRKKIAELDEKKQILEEKFQQAEQSKLQIQYQKAFEIHKRIAEIKSFMSNEKVLENTDLLQQKIGALQQAKQTLERAELGFKKWEGRLKEINMRYLAQPIRVQDVGLLDKCLLLAKNSAYSAETEKLRRELQEKQQEFINIPPIASNDAWEALIEYESWDDDLQGQNAWKKWLFMALGVIFALIGILLGIKVDKFFYAASAIGVGLFICSFFIKSQKKEIQEAQDEQKNILKRYKMNNVQELRDYCQALQKKEDYRLQLMNEVHLLVLQLKKVSEENPQRKDKLDNYAKMFTKNSESFWTIELEEQVKYARELCLEFEEMSAQRNEELEELKKQRSDVQIMEKNLSEKLETFGIDDLNAEQFKNLRERQKEQDQAVLELEMQEKLLKECLGTLTFEELEAKIKLSEQTQADEFSDLQNNDYKNILEELAQFQGKINTLEQMQRSVGEIQEEISAIKEVCDNFNLQLSAIQLAKDKIIQASNLISDDLTPKISKNLSEKIYDLTAKKYNKVLISKDLHISLEETQSSKLVPVTSLSKGTMDLIYLAMRMEFLKVLYSDKILPLVLDDSFVHLDDNRIENLLNLLAENRMGQIILLTCQKREEEILSSQNIAFNKILI